jgi:hypothetical protein
MAGVVEVTAYLLIERKESLGDEDHHIPPATKVSPIAG